MKLSKIILPVLYSVVFGVLVFCSYVVYNGIKSYVSEMPNYDYGVSDVFTSDVLNVSLTSSDIIVKPYISDKVKVLRSFYDVNSDSNKQESSIIYYEGTYFKNNGVDYSSDEDFDVVSILDGEGRGMGKIGVIK